MASLMKKRVSSANIAACKNPMKSSNIMSGTGPKYGAKYVATMMSTSPAIMLPNNRNESEMRRANSPISSTSPTANPIKPEWKLMNLPIYFHAPITVKPVISITTNEMMASASVTLRSVLTLRRRGKNSFTPSETWKKPIEPMPGVNSRRLSGDNKRKNGGG